MSLTIQIVNYNSRDHLLSCLQSIRDSLPASVEAQIIVVNNDEEGLKEGLEDFEVDLIEQGENVGFGKAHNLGAKRARGRYLLILNPDTKIFPEAILKLMDLFSSDQKVGIATPLLLGENGFLEEEHFGPAKTPLSTIFSKLFASRSSFSEKEAFETDWVSGAAMMIRKDLFRELGGFDEKYFMYFEDVDLCLRAKKRGWKIMVDPRAKIFHKSGQSFSDSRKKKRHYYQSQDYYIKKNFGLFWTGMVKILRLPFYIRNVYYKR